MKRRRTNIVIVVAALIVAAIVYVSLSEHHRDPNLPPPGVAEHLPGATASAVANGAGGTCHLLDKEKIQAAGGGVVSNTQADSLTPGLDRCSWTVHGSDLAKGDVVVVVTRSDLAPAVVQHTKASDANKTRLVAVPEVGKGAVWLASQLALSWPDGKGSAAIQILAAHGVEVDPAKALNELTALANDIRATSSPSP